MSHLSIHFVPGTLLDVCKDLGLLLRSAGILFIRGRAWNNLQLPWGLIRLWNQSIFITPAPCSLPQCGSSPRTGTPSPTANRPNLGAQHPSRSRYSFPLPPSSVRRETQASAALGVHPSAGEEKGEERGEADGGRRSFSAARSSGGDRGGGAPFPPRADCCGVLPIPARVCEGERVRWVGPMGVIEGFGDAEWRFPLPSE